MMETENTHEEYQRQIADLDGRIRALASRFDNLQNNTPPTERLELLEDAFRERVKALEEAGGLAADRLDAHNESLDNHNRRIDELVNDIWPMPEKGEKWREYAARLWHLHEEMVQAAKDQKTLERAIDRERARARKEPATDDQIRKWADRRMFTALKEWGADRDRATSIMDDMVDQDALMERIGDAVAEWAGELTGEYEPPAKPDPERIAEIAPGLTAKPPLPVEDAAKPEDGLHEIPVEEVVSAWGEMMLMGALEGAGADANERIAITKELDDGEVLGCLTLALEGWAQQLRDDYKPGPAKIDVPAPQVVKLPPTEADAAKTLDEDCGPPADPRPPATLADEIAAKMNGSPRDDGLRDHWAAVAQAGINMVRKECKHDEVLVEMLDVAADRANLANRTPAMRAFNPGADRIRECMAHVMAAVAPTKYAKSLLQFNSPKVQKMADEALPAKPPGERYRVQDVALRMAQSMAKQAEEPHQLEVANWMVVCERGLKAHLTGLKHGHGVDVVEIEMRAALRERQELLPDQPRWEPDELAFARAVSAIPHRAKQVKE